MGLQWNPLVRWSGWIFNFYFMKLKFPAAVAMVWCLIGSTSYGAGWDAEPIEPIKAPFAMPQLDRPDIPGKHFDIRDYGAQAGGTVLNTEAFRRAIAAAEQAGGGRVLVPAGVWKTGPIHLRSRIDLHLEEGAEVLFSDQFSDYLPVVFTRVGGIEIYNYSSLIYARDCSSIAITGPGKLNGNAERWWNWKSKESRRFFEMGSAGVPVEERVFGTEEAAIRPSFINFINCQNILLEGFTIGGGPNWTIHPIYCENIIIRRVTVDTWGPNNDGIDPDSCRNVLIEHCRFNTEDDCVVLKSGYNEDGWRVAKATENVVMRHCSSNRGHGGLVIGSEMSGDVRNVYMHDCTFSGTDRAVRIKSRRGRGGVVENIHAENLVVNDMQREVVILNMDYSADTKQILNEIPPVFRNIHIRNVMAEGAPVAILVQGLPDSIIENITFSNMVIHSQKGAILRNATNVQFKNVSIEPATGPVFSLENVSGLAINGAPIGPEGIEIK